MRSKTESSSTTKGRFFEKNSMARLASILTKKFLPILLNGKDLLLNEAGVSKELYQLRQERNKLLIQIDDLDDDLEDKTISEVEYQQQIAVLKKQVSQVRKKISVLAKESSDTKGFLLGAGGSKKFYDAGHGKALMLPNLDAKIFQPDAWARIIHEESYIADMLSGFGLMSQTYQSVVVHVDKYALKSLQSDSFPGLLEKGLQVRDLKNRHHTGKSMLFASFDNIKPAFIKSLLTHINQDIVVLLANRININGASFNLVICDTDQTSTSNESESSLYADANQIIRLYLYDFSIGERTKLDSLYLDLQDENGIPDKVKIAAQVERYLSLAIYSIKHAITDDEMKKLVEQVRQTSSNSNSISAYTIDKYIKEAFDEIKDDLIEELVAEVVEQLGQSHIKQLDF